MPALDAEIQVGGYCEPLDTFTLLLEQATDDVGRPSSAVLVRPIRLTLTGSAAVQQFFTMWGTDAYMRRSGHIVAREAGQTRYRLIFYDAYCVLHYVRFRPGLGEASYQLILELSPAAVNVNGLHLERHSDLWWEKNRDVRFSALTKPPDPLPSPELQAVLSPTPVPTLSPITGAPQRPKPPKIALDPKQKPLYAPTIAKWYKKGGSIEVLDNGNWKFTDWEHNSVVYEGDEPNFDEYARQQVDIDDMEGDCYNDFIKANTGAPLGPRLPENTWHHKQNMRTMQEVPTDIHERFTHYGGRFMLKQQANPTRATSKRVIKRK